jgi:hypothetical protein
MEEKTVAAICSGLTPKSVNEVCSLLELVGYYCRFVECFAQRSASLHKIVNDSMSDSSDFLSC